MHVKINTNMRHKSEYMINIKLSSVTCGSSFHLTSPSDYLDWFYFVCWQSWINLSDVSLRTTIIQNFTTGPNSSQPI